MSKSLQGYNDNSYGPFSQSLAGSNSLLTFIVRNIFLSVRVNKHIRIINCRDKQLRLRIIKGATVLLLITGPRFDNKKGRCWVVFFRFDNKKGR